jgi:hypothetical protein
MEDVVIIQPIQPVMVTIKIGENQYDCQMISLSETVLELNGHDYVEKERDVLFLAQYFRGKATVRDVTFTHFCFTYKLDIKTIQFQPGLIINTRL